MLSYRHAFHAGNFADVFKHVLLIQLIRALQRKDKPFRVFDTHAGAGRYDLHSAPARKNREYQNGIGQLWDEPALGPELREYREQVRVLNPDGALREYPGSPRLIRTLLRPEDRLTLIELHPGDYPALKAEFTGDRQVAVHHADGYASLKAFLPPRNGADWCLSIRLLNCGMNLTDWSRRCRRCTGAGRREWPRSGIRSSTVRSACAFSGICNNWEFRRSCARSWDSIPMINRSVCMAAG